jgi:hypothetical protein
VIDPIDLSLRLIGAFYVFAGLVAMRAQLTGHLIDRAIAAISLKPTPRPERLKMAWWLSASFVIFAGGVALMFLLKPASWLFLASALAQGIYFAALAPLYFDKTEPPDAAGRRSSINAFVLYTAATAYVVWADTTGHLSAVNEATPIALIIWATTSLAFVAHIGRHLAGWNRGRREADEPFDVDDNLAATPKPSDSQSIKLMADYDCDPLWALDDGLFGCFLPEEIGLSSDLCRDLNAWSDAFTASLDRDDPSNDLWTKEQRSQHQAQERPLALRVAGERRDLKVHIVDHDTLELILVEPEAAT